MKIISYNLLSPSLCSPTEFVGYSPEVLDRNKRRDKIFIQLKEWVLEKNIFLLQEIPIHWKGNLEMFFEKNNYYFYLMNYGRKVNGFFGVATAIPKDLYEVHKVEYLHVGEFISTQSAERIYQWNKSQLKHESDFMKSVNDIFEEVVGLKEKEIEEINNNILEAKNRSNIAVKITLSEKERDQKFILYNYHMPCCFQNPIIQIMHLDAFKRIMRNHPEIPTIWGGDFNIQPDSDAYIYLTGGVLSEKNQIYLRYGEYVKDIYYSVLDLKNEKEPPYTIFSHTKFGGEFKGTLDYFFINQQSYWKIIEAERKVHSANKMPNAEHPSDHLPIFCEIELNYKD